MPAPVTTFDGPAPLRAMAFGPVDGPAVPVDPTHPLPVRTTPAAATATPLAGSTAATAVMGPYAPDLGRPIVLTLSGSWTGSARLLRSTDGGTTRLPLTYSDGSAKPAWTGAVNAPVAEETVAAATYYLDVTLASGTLTYRMEQ